MFNPTKVFSLDIRCICSILGIHYMCCVASLLVVSRVEECTESFTSGSLDITVIPVFFLREVFFFGATLSPERSTGNATKRFSVFMAEGHMSRGGVKRNSTGCFRWYGFYAFLRTTRARRRRHWHFSHKFPRSLQEREKQKPS